MVSLPLTGVTGMTASNIVVPRSHLLMTLCALVLTGSLLVAPAPGHNEKHVETRQHHEASSLVGTASETQLVTATAVSALAWPVKITCTQ